jgi:prephenate dehydrogenase
VSGLPQPVLVVGTGLIGTSLALALARRGVRCLLADRDAEALAVAVQRGAGVEATPEWTSPEGEPRGWSSSPCRRR